jgi:choice-of-anchor C domain-containing protein
MRYIRSVAALAVGLVGCGEVAQDGSVSESRHCLAPSVIVNGSFEDGSVDPGAGLITALGVGDSSIAGWTVVSGDIDLIGGYWQAADGARSLDLSGFQPGAIRQLLDTEVGQEYVVTFALSGEPSSHPPPVKSVQVSAAGVSADFSFDTATGTTRDAMGWQDHTFKFVATEVTTTLTFTSLVAGDAGPAIDNVRVAPPGELAIDNLALHDLDGSALAFLSVDGTNPYLERNARVHGTIHVSTVSGDPLVGLKMDLLANGTVMATAHAAPAVADRLGQDELDLSTSSQLFLLPSPEAAKVPETIDRVLLRVTATSANGHTATREIGPVSRLVRYTALNRYNDNRDETFGGDDWIQPRVLPLLNRAVDISRGRGLPLYVNDIANMHAGSFPPDHFGQGHAQARGVDLDFGGALSLYDRYMNRPQDLVGCVRELGVLECIRREAFHQAFALLLRDLLKDAQIGREVQVIWVCGKDVERVKRKLEPMVSPLSLAKVKGDDAHCDHFHLNFR